MNVTRQKLPVVPRGCQHRYITEVRDARMILTITNNIVHLTSSRDLPRMLYDIVRFCSNPTCERVQYAVESPIYKREVPS